MQELKRQRLFHNGGCPQLHINCMEVRLKAVNVI